MNWRHNISQRTWIIICLLLLIPALILNLGIHPFLEDEAIRATVALEMMLSGDYFTPTIGGSLYYYKPPLYNWILIGVYTIFGSVDEWTSRFSTLLFLGLFSFYIYWIHRRNNFSRKASILIFLIYLTCGRILFWDSFLGLIDICFSVVMYVMMCELYMSSKQEKWSVFYVLSYFLTTIGFLLKGFPAFVFLGITILLLHYLNRSWRKLFQPSHLGGILLMSILLAGYYYLNHQSGNVERNLGGLLQQSTTRTFLDKGIGNAIVHIFTYPFENIYHFLPWSLFAILLMRPGFRRLLRKHDFVYFSALCFLANILVYWVSPQVYPRYILMLTPFAFTVFYYFYEVEIEAPTWRIIGLRHFFMMLVLTIPVFMSVSLLNDKVQLLSHWPWKMLIIGLMTTAITVLYFFSESPRMVILIAMLLVVRIAFNLFVMPIRAMEDEAALAKDEASRISDQYGQEGLRVYKESIIDVTSTFYLENNLRYIISRDTTAGTMIFDPRVYSETPVGYEVVDSFFIRRDARYLKVIRKK